MGLLTSALGVLALRLLAYYRDAWRASNYAGPDLVEFARRLDRALAQAREGRPDAPRARVSFVGHSMGGFVVTDALRILSDVFDPGSIRPARRLGLRPRPLRRRRMNRWWTRPSRLRGRRPWPGDAARPTS